MWAWGGVGVEGQEGVKRTGRGAGSQTPAACEKQEATKAQRGRRSSHTYEAAEEKGVGWGGGS